MGALRAMVVSHPALRSRVVPIIATPKIRLSQDGFVLPSAATSRLASHATDK
jgi:hypothetical protein